MTPPAVSGFRFRLYSDDMDELGEFETVVPNWSAGDELPTGSPSISAR
jgi:hypothetical protein